MVTKYGDFEIFKISFSEMNGQSVFDLNTNKGMSKKKSFKVAMILF